MSALCCVACGGFRVTLGGTDHAVTDAAGRLWRFEFHPYMGPMILRGDGNPITRQPGSRSPFWPAFKAWQARHQQEAA